MSGEVTPQLVQGLCERSREQMRTDAAAAAISAEAACLAARFVRDGFWRAEALRMKGHACYLGGSYRRAAAAYRRAIGLLEKEGRSVDVGRTLSSALQTLIYLGQYEEALHWASRARAIFECEGDRLRLARLDSNEANILHRQDRYVEALRLYQRAVEALREMGDWDSAAIAARNMAVCHGALFDFENALACYREAERIYRERNLPLLAAEVTDNIAYLYFSRGEYLNALSAYRAAEVEGRGNTYQKAVSRLDQSELLLELNLESEAEQCAKDALERFTLLGVRYERAQAAVYLSIACFRLGETRQALELLQKAQKWFGRERNRGWQALVRFYRAAIWLQTGRISRARASARAAARVVEDSPLHSKAIAALLLLARIEMESGDLSEARRILSVARDKGRPGATLPIRCQMAMTHGRILEAAGDVEGARGEYEAARQAVEIMRGQFGGERLRVSFLADKLEIYESWIRLALAGGRPLALERVISVVEEAKSRSLAESMTSSIPAAAADDTPELRSLRRELSWRYRELDRAEAVSPQATESLQELRGKVQECENRLTSEWTLSISASQGRVRGQHFSCEGLQARLPDSAGVLEYFSAAGRLYVFVITAREIKVRELGSMAAIERACHALRFQMSRGLFRKGMQPSDPAWLGATEFHLRRLYGLLMEPVREWLPAGHWVVLPHGSLHRVPFHAFHDGGDYIISARTLSYAPSAAVLLRSLERNGWGTGGAVIFAVPDERAPHILDEVRHVGQALPGATLFTGAEATIERWKEHSKASRILHLATHGIFREDNPLFSSVRLADGHLFLYDLYGSRMAAELVTMSGCATGVQETHGAGEVMGLARGLLAAGTHTAQLALWEVSDASTAEYMGHFYRHLAANGPAGAARFAMLDTKRRFPHPFHWAPFAVMGRVKELE